MNAYLHTFSYYLCIQLNPHTFTLEIINTIFNRCNGKYIKYHICQGARRQPSQETALLYKDILWIKEKWYVSSHIHFLCGKRVIMCMKYNVVIVCHLSARVLLSSTHCKWVTGGRKFTIPLKISRGTFHPDNRQMRSVSYPEYDRIRRRVRFWYLWKNPPSSTYLHIWFDLFARLLF